MNIEIADINLVYYNGEMGGFNEGYYFEVYKVSKADIQKFIQNEKKVLPNKGGWKKIDWTKTPSDSSFQNIQVLALNYYTSETALKSEITKVKTLLKDEKGYYSAYYKLNDGEPIALQLFVIDSDNYLIYAIESKI